GRDPAHAEQRVADGGPVKPLPQDQLDALAHHARQADEQAAWPAESWSAMARLGAPRWGIATAFGGDGITGTDLLLRYDALAGACGGVAGELLHSQSARRGLPSLAGQRQRCTVS